MGRVYRISVRRAADLTAVIPGRIEVIPGSMLRIAPE
jgi:hypothetical protein